ncbi:MAG: FliH/SctL family protein [Pseudomonadota bacterium]
MSESLTDSAEWSPPQLGRVVGLGTQATHDPEVTEAARQDGFQQGFQQGLNEGRAQGQQLLGSLQSLIDAMAVPFQESDAELVNTLLDLTRRVSEAVLRRELQVDPGVVTSVLEESLRVLSDEQRDVSVRINPQDAALCRQMGLVAREKVTFIEDPGFQRGGLEVKSGSQLVDARVEARLQQVLANLYLEAGLPEPDYSASSGFDSLSPMSPSSESGAETAHAITTETTTETMTATGTEVAPESSQLPGASVSSESGSPLDSTVPPAQDPGSDYEPG